MKFLKYFSESIDEQVITQFSKKFSLPKKVVELIISRGVKTEQEFEKYLHPKIEHLYNPFLLKNMDKAVERIKQAVKNEERILIFGDYDVDGVSATAIMVKTFEKLGTKVNYYLPNRFIDGYGLTNEVIDKIKTEFNPNLIITVDCGISCHKEVEYANSLGIEVIVTDHHEIPYILPPGIVVNAKLPNQEYPFRELCGTGLAFKISQALIGPLANEFLPIAAIATIADIVPLKDENRTIVKLGLACMDKYLPAGLKMMFKELKLSINSVTSLDIAFKIAPKLNASGRMGDAKDSLLLYLEKNPVKIKKLINDIITHNTARQQLCTIVYDDCKEFLKTQNMSKCKSIILASDRWDQGILGIVCARLMEEYNRPVFLFSKVNGHLKGSARSLPDVNVHALLSDMQDILETFGGHTVAAGLSLAEDKFKEFKTRVNSYIHENINDKILEPITYYDLEISLDEIDERFVNGLNALEPLGCDNQPPKFKIDSDNIYISPIKGLKNHANIIIGKKLNLVYFNYIEQYYKLKYSKNKSFIFEFQNSKYKSQYFKGILKSFDSNFSLEEQNIINLESFSLQELYYKDKDQAKFKTITSNEILKFVSECSLSVFGTAFVFKNAKSLEDFVLKYNTEDINLFEIAENISFSGFNSILFAPVGIEWAKNFLKIVFMDGVFDSGYIKAINEISDAEIYINADAKFDRKIFNKVYPNRNNFLKIYSIFSKINNVEFYNLQFMYDIFHRNKISFIDFICALFVFEQLGLIKWVQENGKHIVNTVPNIKNPLTNSTMFYFINFLKNTK